MGTSLSCVNIVDKGKDVFFIAVIVLHRQLDNDIVFFTVKIDRFFGQHLFVLVQVAHKVRNTAVKGKGYFFGCGKPLVA